MFNFLHTFHPQPILFHIGPVAIHWYGLLIAVGMIIAWLVIAYLVKSGKGSGKRSFPVGVTGANNVSDTRGRKPYGEQSSRAKRATMFGHVENVAVQGILYGLIGARLYHVLSELPYYIEHPLQIFMIWRGGLGIFGALVGGALALWWYGKKHNLRFLLFADIFAPGIIIAQAIGRWGNYFNSELFGLPTSKAWGIPIAFVHRPAAFMKYEYFHPTFLYESLWNIVVFIVLFLVFKQIYRRKGSSAGKVFALYLILYSLGRFLIEFIRIDPQPEFFGLRLAQMVAIGAFVVGWTIVVNLKKKQI
ncbi:prolipoprotein diacylglyceryl transferase [Patescibacteria group bacterium AH-259-L05]|nr:prolipoprotein diacylglyceryl transferase [Patescibacteria group bacterium AH-259-L05]